MNFTKQQTQALLKFREEATWMAINGLFPAPEIGCDPYMDLMNKYDEWETAIETDEESFGVDMHNTEIQIYEHPGRLNPGSTRPVYGA